MSAALSARYFLLTMPSYRSLEFSQIRATGFTAEKVEGEEARVIDFKDRFLFILLLIFIVGYLWMPSVGDVESTPQNLFFYLAMMPAFLLIRGGAVRSMLEKNSLLLLSTVFILYLGATSLWAGPETEFSTSAALFYAFSTLVFVLAVFDLLRADRRQIFMQVYLGAALAITGVSCIEFILGHDHYHGRLSSAVHGEHPNLFAHYLGIAALINLDLLLQRDCSRGRRIGLAAGFALLWLGVGLTRGRTVLVALGLCCVLVILRRAPRRWLIALLGLMLAGLILPTPGGTPLLAGFLLRSDSGRVEIYRSTVERALMSPYFGSGINVSDDVEFSEGSEDFPFGHIARHPHSAFLATFLYGGLFGLLLLLSVVALAMVRGSKKMRHSGDWLPLALLSFGVLCLLPDGHRLISEAHLSSWMLFWFPIALIAQFDHAEVSPRSK